MAKETVEIDIDEALDWELDGRTLRQTLVDEACESLAIRNDEGHFEIRVALFVGYNPTNSPGKFMVTWKPA